MKKKKIISGLKVEDIAAKGKGIARHNGKIIFVDEAIPGDVVDVRLYKNKKDYGIGRIHKLQEGSSLRKDAFCKHFEYCGGCKWQHLPYEQQLKYKQQIVEEAFTHITKIHQPQVMPVIGSSSDTFYRNKLEFTFSNKRWLTPQEISSGKEIDSRDALGFHIAGAFDKVLDIEECWLQASPSNEIRNTVKDHARSSGLSFYDIRKQHGLLRNLIIRTSSTGESMVIMVFGGNDQSGIGNLMSFIDLQFPAITSLQYMINTKKNDSIHDLTPHLFKGKDHITEHLGEMRFKIGPKSFFQTNSKQAETLYEKTLEFAGLRGDEVVYDLYSGTGTIANYMAPHCQKVIGIEQVPEATGDAYDNSKLNEVKNAIFISGDMESVLSPQIFEEHGAPEVILTDPPRAGMHKKVVQVIADAAPDKIVYISCNPATQARDVELLMPQYALEKIQPVDMFPHTFHIENITLLKRR